MTMNLLIAAELALSIAASHHTIPGDFNERHLEVRLSEGAAFATAYHNSESRLSLGVGVRAEKPLGRCYAFAEAALVTGYAYAPVLPMARAGAGCGPVSAWIAPTATPDGDFGAVAGFQVEVAKW